MLGFCEDAGLLDLRGLNAELAAQPGFEPVTHPDK